MHKYDWANHIKTNIQKYAIQCPKKATIEDTICLDKFHKQKKQMHKNSKEYKKGVSQSLNVKDVLMMSFHLNLQSLQPINE